MNTRSSTRLNRIKREHKDGNQEQVPKPNINNGTRTSTRRKSIFKRMSSRLSMSLRLPGRNKSKSKRIKTQAHSLKDKNKDPPSGGETIPIIKVNSKRITRSVTRGEKRDWDTPDVVSMVMATETATVREEDVAPVAVPYLEDEHETVNITGTGISTSMKGIQSCKEDEDGEEIVYTTQHARKKRTNSPKFHLIEVDQSNVGVMKPDLIEMEDKTTNHIDINTRVDVDVDENKGDQFESYATPIPSVCESESSEPLASNVFNSESDSKIGLEIDPDTDNDSDLINPSASSDTDTSSHENTYTNANANDAKEASSCNNASIVNIIEEENMDLAHVDNFCGDDSISAHFDVVEDAASVQADVDLDLDVENNDERHNKVVGDINEMHNLSAELPLGDDTVLQVDNKEMPNDNYYDKEHAHEHEHEHDKDEFVGMAIESGTSDEEDVVSESFSSFSVHDSCETLSTDEVEIKVQDQDCFNIYHLDEDEKDLSEEDTRGTVFPIVENSNTSHGAHLDRSDEIDQDTITTLGDTASTSMQGQVASPLSQCQSVDTRPWDEKENIDIHTSRDGDEGLDMDISCQKSNNSVGDEHDCHQDEFERSDRKELSSLSVVATVGGSEEGENASQITANPRDVSHDNLLQGDNRHQIELSEGMTVTVCNEGSKYFGNEGNIIYMTKMKAALDLGGKKPVLLNRDSVISSNLQKDTTSDFEDDVPRNVVDDFLSWELGIRLKVIAPGSKYKGMIGTFVGLTQSRKSVRLIFKAGTKPNCLKPTSVVQVSTSLDNGHDVEVDASDNNVVRSVFSTERKEEATIDTNKGIYSLEEKIVTSAQIAQEQSSCDPSASKTQSSHAEELIASIPSETSRQCPLSEIRIEPNVAKNAIENVHSEWAEGTLVEIVSGKYKDKIGRFLKLTESQKSVKVQFEDAPGPTILRRKSVHLAKGSNIQVSRIADILQKPLHQSTKQSVQSLKGDSAATFHEGDMVFIMGGMHMDKCGEVIKVCPKTAKIAFRGDPKNVRSVRLQYIKVADEHNQERIDDFRVPDHKQGGIFFGSRRVTRLHAEIDSPSDEDSFITHMLGRRIMSKHVLLNKKESEEPIEQIIVTNDGTFQLILSKLVDSDGGGLFHKPKEMQYMYMQTHGPGLETIPPKDMLETIADFSAISTRKAKARLELFASPAYKYPSSKKHLLKFLNQSIFGDIEEKGHVGCGFICEDLLVEILGMNAIAEKAICIQVRIFIPMKGVYKGMLMKKQITNGPKILLPDSMQKIPASKKDGRSENACLLVTAAGVDPSTTNLYMGRLPSIDPSINKPPPKSFNPKELSTMLLRLFKSLGVPHDLAQDYSKNCKGSKHEISLPQISHAFLRGVADPIGCIPSNFVFITGVSNTNLLSDSIFITRSPVIKASDGHMVQVLRRCPESMSAANFEWLQKLPFGAVIFGFPEEGMLSMPERIANGDLDGDRYFVCWEKEILKHIKADEWVDKQVIKEDTNDTLITSSSKSKPGGENWFSEVQEFLKDPSAREMGHLIGILYRESEKAADSDKERFMRNPNAEAFADAYYQALENGKHGTAVLLPIHLWDRIPKGLHRYLREA